MFPGAIGIDVAHDIDKAVEAWIVIGWLSTSGEIPAEGSDACD